MHKETPAKIKGHEQHKGKVFFSLRTFFPFNSPVMSNPAVRWDVGEPANAIDPNVAPPRVP